ncbi:MAG: excinuclease ABC subunit UvrC [Planctomycetota bacterium]
MHPHVEEIARNLPHEPGCYLFKDGGGRVLYVGKAADLRKRVTSYLKRGGDGRFLLAFLEDEARDLDFVATGTEQEAILLENTLIKKFKPRHNLRLKDDKSFLMLRLDEGEDWPWFRFVRRRRADGARYFGPFSSARSIRRTLRLLHRLVPLRDCSDAVFAGRTRPCLKHQIGRCPAPCVGLVTREAYRAALDRAVAILSGATADVEVELERRMGEAAEALRFEEAQARKADLDALRRISERQQVVGVLDRDVVGLWRDAGEAWIAVLSYRDAGLEDTRTHRLRTHLPDGELVAQVVGRLYDGDRYIPREVLLPAEPADRDALEAWLRHRRDGPVDLLVPQRGDKRKAVEVASRNARLVAEAAARGADTAEHDLEELRALLGLAAAPRRIHCLDVSTIQGRDTVASRVAAVDGRACPAEYRRFRIRGDAQGDDFAAMRQAVARSLGLCLDDDGDPWPDLLVVDGGRGQLSAARDALAELGEDLPLAALAKDKPRGGGRTGERVFVPGRPTPIPLAEGTPTFRILCGLRDEAHRFAIGYHRKLRERLGSELDDIDGLGPRRRRALLRRFGSIAGIRAAALEDLCRVRGLPRAVAERVHERLREGG